MTRMIPAEGKKMTSRKQRLSGALGVRLVVGASVALALATAMGTLPGGLPRGSPATSAVLVACANNADACVVSSDGGVTTYYGDTPPGPSDDPIPGADMPEVDIYGTPDGSSTAANDYTPDNSGGEADIVTVTVTAKPAPPPTCKFAPLDAAQLIWRHEGAKAVVYPDTAKPPNPTVGVGFNLNRKDAPAILATVGADYNEIRSGEAALTPQQMNVIFASDYLTAVARARKYVPSFDQLSSGTQAALTDMAFPLGNKLSQFQAMIGDLSTGDFLAAANEMLDSAWARQVGPGRSMDDASLMANCH